MGKCRDPGRGRHRDVPALGHERAYNSGATFAKSDFTFADLDTVYSVVQGCDDAASLPSGVQTARATLILPQIRRAPRHHATGRL